MEPGPFEVPRDALCKVIFGMRTPQADIKLITELVKQYSGCVEIEQMQPDDSDFGFVARRL